MAFSEYLNFRGTKSAIRYNKVFGPIMQYLTWKGQQQSALAGTRVKLRVVLRAGSSWSGKIITSGQSLFFGSQGVPKCSQLTHCTVPLSIPVGKGLMLPFPVTRCHISHFSREMARRQFNPLV